MLPHRRAISRLNNYAYGSFTSQGPLVALGASLKARLTADDHGTARMTDDGSGLISSWTSNDGAALTVTAAGTARPTWSASAISSPTGNTYPGIIFDGVANCFVSTTLTNIPTGAAAGEIWILFSHTSTGVGNLCGYGANSSGQRRTLLITSSRTPQVTDGSVMTDDTHLTPGGVHVLGGFWSGTTQGGQFDGLPLTDGIEIIASLSTGTTRLRIGASLAVSPATFLTGIVCEVLITTLLTSLQRMQLEAYLLRKVGWHRYRLPNNHPFYNLAP